MWIKFFLDNYYFYRKPNLINVILAYNHLCAYTYNIISII